MLRCGVREPRERRLGDAWCSRGAEQSALRMGVGVGLPGWDIGLRRWPSRDRPKVIPWPSLESAFTRAARQGHGDGPSRVDDPRDVTWP